MGKESKKPQWYKWGFAYFGPWDDPDAALAKYKEQYGNVSPEDQDNVSSAKKIVKGRPKKPRPDFPLYAHSMGRWCIKIKGISHYFGHWDDPDEALQEYMDVKDDLLAGRPVAKKGALHSGNFAINFSRQKE